MQAKRICCENGMQRLRLGNLQMTRDDFKRQIEKGMSVAELLIYLESISRQESSCATTGDGDVTHFTGSTSSGESIMTNNGSAGIPRA